MRMYCRMLGTPFACHSLAALPKPAVTVILALEVVTIRDVRCPPCVATPHIREGVLVCLVLPMLTPAPTCACASCA